MPKEAVLVGLTERAENFVKGLKEVPSSHRESGLAGGQSFLLRKWELPNTEAFRYYKDRFVYEHIQITGYSDESFVLTCLEVCNVGLYAPFLEWVRDPEAFEAGYDKKQGIYWS